MDQSLPTAYQTAYEAKGTYARLSKTRFEAIEWKVEEYVPEHPNTQKSWERKSPKILWKVWEEQAVEQTKTQVEQTTNETNKTKMKK